MIKNNKNTIEIFDNAIKQLEDKVEIVKYKVNHINYEIDELVATRKRLELEIKNDALHNEIFNLSNEN